MLLAAALAVFSALLGGALALLSRRRRVLLELTRTFAFAAAAGVVLFHLLPELLPAMGGAALLWIALGFALPWLLELGAGALGPGLLRGLPGARVAAEVGFAALVFHSVVEGLALVAALQAPKGKLDLEIALVAHHAPLTAAVALPFLQLSGPRAALWRVLGVAAAGLCGVLASGLLPGLRTDAAALQVATAVTAGALLHVVADEIRAQELGSVSERAADLLACALGLGVAGLGALLQPGEERGGALLPALAALALAAAPALLAWLAARRFTRLPVDAVVAALLLIGPWPAAVLLLLLLLAPGAWAASGAEGLLEPLRRRGPWLLLLLGAAAALQALLPSTLPRTPWASLLLLALPIAARADVLGATLLAGVLAGKGVPPGLLLSLVAGGTLLSLRSLRGARVAVAGTALACTAVAVAGERAGLPAAAALELLPVPAQLAAHPVRAAAALVAGALVLATFWTTGARGWFAPLRHRARGGPGDQAAAGTARSRMVRTIR